MLGENASSSPSSSSDDQTPVVEDWTGSGMVVAEEIVLAQDEIEITHEEVVLEPEEMSVEVPVPSEPASETIVEPEDDNSKSTSDDTLEKSVDIEPSFERLSILPSETTSETAEQDVEMESKVCREEDVEQPCDPTQDSQGSMDAESSNSNQVCTR